MKEKISCHICGDDPSKQIVCSAFHLAPPKIALALSGGGVKSAAQLGIVKALYEAGIKPEIFTGTSGGAIIATLLAIGYAPDDALKLLKETHGLFDLAYWQIIKALVSKNGGEINGLVKGNRLESVLESIFKQKSIDEIQNCKYAVIATDLLSGKEIIFANTLDCDEKKINNDSYEWTYLISSKLSEMVRASCGFPGVFIPKVFGRYTLVDGGLTNNLPSDTAYALGADRVISVSLANQPHTYKVGGVVSILSRSFSIIFDRSGDNNLKDHDIFINPNVDSVRVFDLDEIEECYLIGYKYGQSIAEKIKYALENNSAYTI